MKKNTSRALIYILLIAMLLISSDVYASTPGVGGPVCNISGTINSVELKNFSENYGGDMYLLDIRIDSISEPAVDPEFSNGVYTGGDPKSNSPMYICSNMYPINEVANIYIEKSKLWLFETPTIGSKVSGSVDSIFYGNSMTGKFIKMRMISYFNKVRNLSATIGVLVVAFLLYKRRTRVSPI